MWKSSFGVFYLLVSPYSWRWTSLRTQLLVQIKPHQLLHRSSLTGLSSSGSIQASIGRAHEPLLLAKLSHPNFKASLKFGTGPVRWLYVTENLLRRGSETSSGGSEPVNWLCLTLFKSCWKAFFLQTELSYMWSTQSKVC